jgi:hypothetical protein
MPQKEGRAHGGVPHGGAFFQIRVIKKLQMLSLKGRAAQKIANSVHR